MTRVLHIMWETSPIPSIRIHWSSSMLWLRIPSWWTTQKAMLSKWKEFEEFEQHVTRVLVKNGSTSKVPPPEVEWSWTGLSLSSNGICESLKIVDLGYAFLHYLCSIAINVSWCYIEGDCITGSHITSFSIIMEGLLTFSSPTLT